MTILCIVCVIYMTLTLYMAINFIETVQLYTVHLPFLLILPSISCVSNIAQQNLTYNFALQPQYCADVECSHVATYRVQCSRASIDSTIIANIVEHHGKPKQGYVRQSTGPSTFHFKFYE